MNFFSSEFLTQLGHFIIIAGVAAAYFRAKQAKDLVEIQKETIDILRQGFKDCKENLNKLGKKIK